MKIIQPQTIASDLGEQLNAAYYISHLKPFKLARLTVEARKLFNTPEAYFGYATLGALAVFDDKLTDDEKLSAAEKKFDIARQCPHDAYVVDMFLFNSLVRLHRREQAYALAERLFSLAGDMPERLYACFNRSLFTGQLNLMGRITDRLEKLGKDVKKERETFMALSESGVDEKHLRGLLVEAGRVMKQFNLFHSADRIDTDDNIAYLTLLAIPDSDPEAVADCDIAISRAKVRYALEHGLDLSKLVIGCELAGASL